VNTHLKGTLWGILILMLITNLAQAVVVPLESRLGGSAYYDPNLDITWAANANINNNLDTWDNQRAWAASLTIGSVSGWRLPSIDVNGDNTVVDCSASGVAGCADNEMGYLYWKEGITSATSGPFSNLATLYWSGTELATGSTLAWMFNFSSGSQGSSFSKNDGFFAWAVRSGDVGLSSVPVPAAVWLFGSGLMGLLV